MPNFKITLRAARVNCQLSLEEAAKKAGVSASSLRRYECNSGDTPFWVAKKLLELYKLPSFSYIEIGEE